MIPDLFLLQTGSLLLALWLCLPKLLLLLRGVQIQNGFNGGSEEAASYWLHDIDEGLFQQIGVLGFRPVGVYWEKYSLGRTFQEIVFACPTMAGFGMLYPNNQIGPRRSAFLTVFTSGAVVFTKNYQGGVEVEEGDFIAGVPGKKPLESLLRPDGDPDDPLRMDLDERAPLEEVLSLHRRRVTRFVQEGHVPLPGTGPESFLETQRRYYQHPRLQAEFLAAEKFLLGIQLAFFALVPGILVYLLGPNHPAPWICLLGEGVALAGVRYGMTTAGVVKLLSPKLRRHSGSLAEGPAKPEKPIRPVSAKPRLPHGIVWFVLALLTAIVMPAQSEVLHLLWVWLAFCVLFEVAAFTYRRLDG